MKLCLLSLFSWLLASANTVVVNAQSEGEAIYSQDGKLTVTLTIGPVLYNNTDTGLVQNLVGYNGMVGGPTLYAKPGDEVSLTLVNDLPPEPCNTNLAEFWNTYHAVDRTNLHFHGLHIPDYLNPVAMSIGPGETYEYLFTIPEDHMGGTHWYHPHVAGSSSLQAGGGGAGMFIIQDIPGDLPPEYMELPEMNMRIQFLNMTYLQQDYANGTSGSYLPLCQEFCLPVENRSLCHEFFFQDGPIEGSYNTTLAPDGLEYETTLVNGEERPTIDMVADQWYRIRMLYVPTRFRTLEPAFPDCEVKLMAKDGIYLLEVPRDITAGFMTSGNRADFLIKCPAGQHEFVSLSEANDSSQWIASQKKPSLDRVLAYLNVESGTETPELQNLTIFEPPRPCYVGNALGATPDGEDDFVIMSGLLPHPPDYNLSDPLPIVRPPCCANTSYYDVNGLGPYAIQFRDGVMEEEYDVELEAGTLWDLNYYVPQVHPAHYHMFPYQILELPELGAHSDYWQVGDYHDTLHLTIPDSGYYGKVKIRVNVATVTGRFLAHCHFYRHTDRGMAYHGFVSGEDGMYSPQLTNCYDSMDNRGGFPATSEETSEGGEDEAGGVEDETDGVEDTAADGVEDTADEGEDEAVEDEDTADEGEVEAGVGEDEGGTTTDAGNDPAGSVSEDTTASSAFSPMSGTIVATATIVGHFLLA